LASAGGESADFRVKVWLKRAGAGGPIMNEDLAIRRKRLAYRSRHRGTKELDILVGAFAERHLAGLDAEQLTRFEALLELPEPLLYDWLTGKSRPPPAHDNDVTNLILQFKLKP
jgi:antitoxin CptB